jgi:predicted  nucleic acid-binding Zn-ribbon protein
MVHRTRPASLILALPACALLLLGCEEDPASEAIRDANVKLTALTNISGDYAETTYSSVIQNLRTASNQGSDAQKAAAQLLIARAEFGLAAKPARQAAEAEAAAADSLREIRSVLGEYLTIKSLADANASYSPGEDLAEIDEEIEAKAREIDQARAAKAEIDQRVQQLRDQAARLREQADELRLQERDMRDAVLAAETAAIAAELMVETQRIRREADAFDVDASKLEARADQIAPESTLQQREIDKLTRQQELLSAARAETVERGETSQQMARDLREKASQAAAELADLASELETLREQTLAPAVERAIAAYGKARSAANQARTFSRGLRGDASGAIIGEAQHAIGDLAAAHATGLEAYIDTFAAIGDTSIEGAGGYASRADQAKEAYRNWLMQAAEAYADAAGAFGGAEEGLGAELTKTADRLRALAGETPGQNADPGDAQGDGFSG